MNSKEKKTVPAPRLRFPGFEGEWEEKKLGEICNVLNNLRRPITGSQRVKGDYPYYGASGIVDYVAEYIFDEPLLLVGEDGAKWGRFEKTAFIAEGKYWVNNHAHVLKPIDTPRELLENYLTMLDLAPFVTGAAPPKLTLGKLKSIPIPLPPTLPEQTHIAAALSSLEAVISAHQSKLEALRQHKRGLMAGLFPAEGEKVPRLRFPEFEGSREWEEKKLGELLKSRPDYGLNAPAVSFSEDLPTYLRITDISEDGKYLTEKKASVRNVITEDYYLQTGEIVLARTGASVGKSYLYNPKDGKLVFAGFLIRLRPQTDKLDSVYLSNFLTTDYYWDWVAANSARSGQPGINSNEYAALQIPLPSLPEQQRIAACLSSLDDLITAQGEKIAALQEFKRGLMQGLFPAGKES